MPHTRTKVTSLRVDRVLLLGRIIVTDIQAGVPITPHLLLLLLSVNAIVTIVAADAAPTQSGCLRRLDRLRWDRLDLAEGVQVLMLPLVDAHIELFPFLLEGFVGELLPHFSDRQLRKKLLIGVQIVIHLDQLLFDLPDIDVGFVFVEADLV